jgi:hypothetical protein
MSQQALVFHADIFWKSANEDVKRAQEIVRSLDELATMPESGEEEAFLILEFGWICERLKQQILLATDYIGAASFREDFLASWSKLTDVTALELLPWVGVLSSPALDRLGWALAALQAFIPESAVNELNALTELDRLERMLEGTAKLIHDGKLLPEKEADIKNEMCRFLIHWFPHTVREVPIAQVSKVYRPEIGIRDLKAAIEYKFADSEEHQTHAWRDLHRYPRILRQR